MPSARDSRSSSCPSATKRGVGCVGQQFFGYKLGVSEVFRIEVRDPDASPSPTATPSPTPTPPVCSGDCNRDGAVSIAELIAIVNIGLERSSVDECPEADVDGDGRIVIQEMIRAVRSSIDSCRLP